MCDDTFFSAGSGDDGKPQPYTPVTDPATSPDYRPSGDWNSPDTAYLTHLGAVGFSINQTAGPTPFDLRVIVK